MIIYKVVNKITGKCYIGKTVKSLKQRASCHISFSKKDNPDFYFHRALKKYGVDNFKWTVLYRGSSNEELSEKEIFYIKKYKSHSTENGYNMTFGGEGCNGHDFSGERNPNYGKKMSEEQKKKISKSRKGQCLGEKNPNFGNPENRKSCMHGKHHTKETKKKLREKLSGSKHVNSKKYIITYPNGKEILIDGLRQFCRKNPKLNRQNLYACIIGRQKQHKGYKCRYAKKGD